MKIDIEEKEELMYVSVELPAIDETARLDGSNREIWLGTADIMTELETRGIEMESLTCVQDSHSVHNISEINRKKTWVFAKTQKVVETMSVQEELTTTLQPSLNKKSVNATTTKKRSSSRRTKK
ncbi:MAG TPA: hypothetical protein EYN38_08020 [Flavobacteriales bacterium]|nr:hypothetical protein [Flavobacteriales bacterium]